MPINTTVCTSASIQFRRAGQQRSDKNTNSCPKTFSITVIGYMFYHASKISQTRKLEQSIKFTQSSGGSREGCIPHRHTAVFAREKIPPLELDLFADWLCGCTVYSGWPGSRVVGVLDPGAEGPGFKLQLRRCRVTVLGKLFTPIVLLSPKQQNW